MNALINVIIKCVATNEITRLVHKTRGCCFALQFESVDDVLATISGFIVFFVTYGCTVPCLHEFSVCCCKKSESHVDNKCLK